MLSAKHSARTERPTERQRETTRSKRIEEENFLEKTLPIVVAIGGDGGGSDITRYAGAKKVHVVVKLRGEGFRLGSGRD